MPTPPVRGGVFAIGSPGVFLCSSRVPVNKDHGIDDSGACHEKGPIAATTAGDTPLASTSQRSVMSPSSGKGRGARRKPTDVAHYDRQGGGSAPTLLAAAEPTKGRKATWATAAANGKEVRCSSSGTRAGGTKRDHGSVDRYATWRYEYGIGGRHSSPPWHCGVRRDLCEGA